MNRTEFEGLSEEARIDCEGLRPGQYVRVQISNVTCELIENFDPTYPLIVGGLKSGEQTLGFVNVSSNHLALLIHISFSWNNYFNVKFLNFDIPF